MITYCLKYHAKPFLLMLSTFNSLTCDLDNGEIVIPKFYSSHEYRQQINGFAYVINYLP